MFIVVCVCVSCLCLVQRLLLFVLAFVWGVLVVDGDCGLCCWCACLVFRCWLLAVVGVCVRRGLSWFVVAGVFVVCVWCCCVDVLL